MAQQIVFPSKENFSFRSKLIDALLDIRLTLSIKKITSDFIMKSELKKIIDRAKEKSQNIKVANAIDDVFDEYFKKDVAPPLKNQSLSIEQMQNLIDKEAYEDSGNGKGRSLVKADRYHQTRTVENSMEQDAKAA